MCWCVYWLTSDIRQRRRRPLELPGVHRDDEGSGQQGPEDLQQAGGLDRVQEVRQARSQGCPLVTHLHRITILLIFSA